MWAQKTKSGKWQYVERYTDPTTMKQKKVSVTLKGHSKTDIKTAQFVLNERIRKAATVPYIDGNITLQMLKDDYIQWKRENLKKQTAISSEFKCNGIIKLLGPDICIDKLTAPYVRKALMCKDPTTYNERITRFKAMMRWGYQNDYIQDVSFIDKLQTLKDKPVRIKVQHKYLEHEEIDLLLANMLPHWSLLTKFLILTGLRIGEAIALNIPDVTDTEIRVNKTYSLVTRNITSTKTEMSDRTIFIQDELRSCILEIEEFRKRVFKENGNVSNIFFPGLNGKRIEHAAYCKYFKSITRKLIGRELTPHCTRHSHVALLAEAGIPLEQISRRLGHADSKVTKEVYMHITERMKEHENERIKGLKLI